MSPSTPAPGNANISVRDYIYHLGPAPLPPNTPIPYSTGLPHNNPLSIPSPPTEPTSTLVLTSPNSTFIDIRILKPVEAKDASVALPNDFQGGEERLEWGFAGRSESTVKARPITERTAPGGGEELEQVELEWEGGLVSHCIWTHWLDSKYAPFTPTSQMPVDEGDMYPIPASSITTLLNPDSYSRRLPEGAGIVDLTLEFGSSWNEGVGQVTAYEEMWRDVPILACDSQENNTKIYCVVARAENESMNTKGLIVRLGQYCQGMVKCGDHILVERWELKDGDWTRAARIGDGFLPCGIMFKEKDLQLGMVVGANGLDWTIEEFVEWDA